MRRLLGLLLLVSLVAACGGDDDDASAPDGEPELTGRTFLSQAVTVDGAPHDLVAGTQVRLMFRDGEVQASAGCNTLSGTVAIEGDRLVVGSMGGTEMGCAPALHAQDEWLAGVLESGPTFVLDGDSLRLESDGTALELLDRETAAPDQPLEHTVWNLDGLVSGAGPDGSVSSAPSPATITFADGEVDVRIEGCNSAGGPATVGDDGTIHIGTLTQTLMACAEPEATTETAVLAVLAGTVAYEIEAGTLTLRHPDGAGLVLRAG